MVSPAIGKVAVVYVNDAYGLGLATVFQSNFAGTATLVPYDPSVPTDPTMLAKLGMDAAGVAAMSGAVLLIAEQGKVALSIVEAMGTANAAVLTLPFYFTDGSQDSGLLDPKAPTAVQALVKKATGTAPASPSGQNYDIFNTNLMSEFGISGDSTSFLAQAYDATYVGAYGVIYASRNGTSYDGRDVAQGMAHLEAGTNIPIGPLNWPAGKGDLVMQGQIDIDGTSGPLQFDPNTGDAPAPILIWGVKPDYSGFTQVQVVQPP
jgi:branched-chain amino acid transport system substrate-binding protein